MTKSNDQIIDVNGTNLQKVVRAMHTSAMQTMMSKNRLDIHDGPAELVFLALALAGEAGELANVVKKLWRDGFGNDALYEEFRMEVADVYAYLIHIAGASGLDLDSVLAEKASHILNERRPEWAERVKDLIAPQDPPKGDARLIAFTGPKTCGKDTMAKVLFQQNTSENPNLFKREPFAYGVKSICHHTFGWSFDDMDDPAFKETPLIEWPSIEPRWAMMDIANFMRDKYGPDVWVHAHRRRVLTDNGVAGSYVITDLRFPNEINYLKKMGALVMYVHRTEAEEALSKAQEAKDPKALNPSEMHYALMKAEADIIIDNDGPVYKGHQQVLNAVRNKFGYWGRWHNQPFQNFAQGE